MEGSNEGKCNHESGAVYGIETTKVILKKRNIER